VKEACSKTIELLTGEGHAGMARDDQALAGVMKPNLTGP